MAAPTYSFTEIIALLDGSTPIEAATIAELVAEECQLYHITELNAIIYQVRIRKANFLTIYKINL